MRGGDPNPTTCEEDPALPEELEDRLHEIYFDTSGPTRERELQKLRDRFPRHVEALTRRLDRLRGADRALSSINPGSTDRVGQYTLMEEIGQGGFGVVYRASQSEPIQREVALKLLLPGVTHTRTLERFEAERNVLAMMSHPNIAHVIDAGTHGHQPYFVMEIVDGDPITVFADRERLSIEDRLALFLQVCAGVQHAHQKGVLHRDIKPSNILVAMRDGEPVPKIIDFGIAKALHDEVSLIESRTEQGGVLGTPEYMSPEQASGQPVDARADIYALGVLLYELVSGRRPFESTELRGAGLAEMARVIRESTPLRASEALVRDRAGMAEAARVRGLDPGQLHAGVRGDLDSILTKTLEKEPDDRYGSASELAAEVRRHLANEPVLARHPAFSYVARKFVRRHRFAVGTAAVVLLVVITAFAFVVWSRLEIEEARDRAVRGREQAEFNSYAANIAAAKAALDSLDIRSLRRRLAATPEKHRHWEWKYLDARSEESIAVHDVGGEVVDLVASPQRVILTMYDGAIVCWDVMKEQVVYRVRGDGSPRRISLHPGGATFMTAARDGDLELWDADTGRRIRAWQSRPRGLWVAAFAPDGKRLAYGCRDGLVRIVELDSGDVTQTLKGHTDEVLELSFDPDGRWLASGSADRTAILWDAQTGAFLRQFEPHKDNIRAVRFEPKRGLFVSASRDGAIEIYDIESGEKRQSFSLDASIYEVVFDPDAPTLLAVGGWRGDSRIRTWNYETGEGTGDFLGHTNGVSTVAMLGGGTFVTGSFDGTMRTWRATDEPAVQRRSVGRVGFALAVHGASNRVVLGTLDQRIFCWRGGTMESVWVVETQDRIREIAFDAEGARLFAVGNKGAFHVHDADTGERLSAPKLDLELKSVAVSPSGDVVAFGGMGGGLVICDAADFRERIRLERGGASTHVSFGPRGRLVASDLDGRVRMFAAKGFRQIWRAKLDGANFHRVRFSPDGALVVATGWGATRFFDAATGQVADFPEAQEPGYATCFSPDGRRIVSSGLDRTVRIFDRNSGTELMVLQEAGPSAISFDATGQQMFGPYRGELFVWSAQR